MPINETIIYHGNCKWSFSFYFLVLYSGNWMPFWSELIHCYGTANFTPDAQVLRQQYMVLISAIILASLQSFQCADCAPGARSTWHDAVASPSCLVRRQRGLRGSIAGLSGSCGWLQDSRAVAQVVSGTFQVSYGIELNMNRFLIYILRL